MPQRIALTASVALAALAGIAAAASAEVPGPPRAITDPASVVSPSLSDAQPAPVQELFFSRSGADAAWSADGKSVFVSVNLTGRFNIWRVDTAGSWPLQLTQSDDRQYGLSPTPDGKRLIFQSDHAGDEMYDLYATPADGGAAVDLTRTADVSEVDPHVSPDGRFVAFERKPKTASVFDLAVLDLQSGEVRVLTHEALPDRLWSIVTWTPDSRALIANRTNALGTSGAVWRVDIADGHAGALTPETKDVVTVASDLSPDGKRLAITSNARTGQLQAGLFELSSGKIQWIAPTPWEESSGHFSRDGKRLTYQLNADGRSEIDLYELGSGSSRRIPLPPGQASEASNVGDSYSPDGGSILLDAQSSNSGVEYWIASSDGGSVRKLTRLGIASLDPAHLPSSQLVHYRSQDGTLISAFLWAPFNASRDGHAPAVVLPHGGPTGQTTDVFNRTALALATRGYFVIAPNVRGSTGYGKAFQLANVKDLGGMDLVDEVYAAKFLVATGFVDAKRIGIAGGSYGGYMTLMAIGKTPDVWAGAVESYGIVDWRTMLEHEDALLQQYERGLLGDPAKDSAVYDAASPIRYLGAAKAPLLVLQGDNDIRVPKEEAEQVIATIRKNGGIVDSHFYPNEGHGFAKRENQIDALERTLAWFDKYLKGDGAH